MKNILSFFYVPLIGSSSVIALNMSNFIDSLNQINDGIKVVGSISISIGTLIHLFIKIRNEIRKNRFNKNVKQTKN